MIPNAKGLIDDYSYVYHQPIAVQDRLQVRNGWIHPVPRAIISIILPQRLLRP